MTDRTPARITWSNWWLLAVSPAARRLYRGTR